MFCMGWSMMYIYLIGRGRMCCFYKINSLWLSCLSMFCNLCRMVSILSHLSNTLNCIDILFDHFWRSMSPNNVSILMRYRIGYNGPYNLSMGYNICQDRLARILQDKCHNKGWLFSHNMALTRYKIFFWTTRNWKKLMKNTPQNQKTVQSKLNYQLWD